MKPRITGFEIYFDDLESAARFYRDTLGMELAAEQPGHYAQFGTNPFLCLERKGAEDYPSPDKAVVFIEVPDLQSTVEQLGARILRYERDAPERNAWAVLHDTEGHNIVLIQSRRVLE